MLRVCRVWVVCLLMCCTDVSFDYEPPEGCQSQPATWLQEYCCGIVINMYPVVALALYQMLACALL